MEDTAGERFSLLLVFLLIANKIEANDKNSQRTGLLIRHENVIIIM